MISWDCINTLLPNYLYSMIIHPLIVFLPERRWFFPSFKYCQIQAVSANLHFYQQGVRVSNIPYLAKLAKVRLTNFYHSNGYGMVFSINWWLDLEACSRFRFISLVKNTSYMMVPLTSHQEAQKCLVVNQQVKLWSTWSTSRPIRFLI